MRSARAEISRAAAGGGGGEQRRRTVGVGGAPAWRAAAAAAAAGRVVVFARAHVRPAAARAPRHPATTPFSRLRPQRERRRYILGRESPAGAQRNLPKLKCPADRRCELERALEFTPAAGVTVKAKMNAPSHTVTEPPSAMKMSSVSGFP